MVVDIQTLSERWVEVEWCATDCVTSGSPEAIQLEETPQGLLYTEGGELGEHEAIVFPELILDRSGGVRSLRSSEYKAIWDVRYVTRSDELWLAFLMTRLAYVRNETLVRSLLDRAGCTLIAHHSGSVAAGADVHQLVLARHIESGQLYLGFKGSTGKSDWQTNLHARQVPFEDWGKVHDGFLWTTMQTTEQLGVELDADLIISGHSLGAAVATLFFAVNRDELPSARVYAFAPPPLGDPAFQQRLSQYRSQLTKLVVPGEELDHLNRALDDLPDAMWGDVVVLPPTGKAGGRYHQIFNYVEGTLRHLDYDASCWLQHLPLCVSQRLDCATSDPARHLSPASWQGQGDERNQAIVEGFMTHTENTLLQRSLHAAPVARDPSLYILAEHAERAGALAQAERYRDAIRTPMSPCDEAPR